MYSVLSARSLTRPSRHFFEEAAAARSPPQREYFRTRPLHPSVHAHNCLLSYESCQAEKRVKTYQVSRGNAAREKGEVQKGVEDEVLEILK